MARLASEDVLDAVLGPGLGDHPVSDADGVSVEFAEDISAIGTTEKNQIIRQSTSFCFNVSLSLPVAHVGELLRMALPPNNVKNGLLHYGRIEDARAVIQRVVHRLNHVQDPRQLRRGLGLDLRHHHPQEEDDVARGARDGADPPQVAVGDQTMDNVCGEGVVLLLPVRGEVGHVVGGD